MRGATLLSLATLLILSACAQSEPPHEVSWYAAHREATESKVLWCKDSADRERSVDCANAQEAKRRLHVGSQKDLPPIDWNAASVAH